MARYFSLCIFNINDVHKCTDLRLIHYVDGKTAYNTLKLLNSLADMNIVLNLLPVINIRGQNLPQTSQIEFLGVIIDDKLSSADQVSFICTKVSSLVGTI